METETQTETHTETEIEMAVTKTKTTEGDTHTERERERERGDRFNCNSFARGHREGIQASQSLCACGSCRQIHQFSANHQVSRPHTPNKTKGVEGLGSDH